MKRKEKFEENLKKIIEAEIDTVYVIFPYNQKNLWIPDDEFWAELKGMMGNKSFLICSPNALVAARPKIHDSRHLITVSEMVLNYWQEIQAYLEINSRIQNIIFISTDINIERIKRDLNIVFHRGCKGRGVEYEVKERIRAVSPSFWKSIYKIRELVVFQLPIWLYKFLGERR